MIKRYPNLLVGWSGHEAPTNYDPIKIAIAKGAMLFERHVGFPTEKIKLNQYSMNPQEVENWIEAALISRSICGGSDEKVVTQGEIDSLLSLKRGVYVKNPVKKGSVIKHEDVFFAMPCEKTQLTSGEFGQRRTKYVASKDYGLNEIIIEKPQKDTISEVRNIIHDAKGMIFEAGLILGNDFDIELSHHYGIENFAECGTCMLTLVNKDYCKKILYQFPNQKHPEHYHKIKEETFIILVGSLNVTIEEEKYELKKGDILTIEKGQKHSFESNTGAIFEEISTEHLIDDSYYTDEKIQNNLKRKSKIMLFNT